jgi:hypothetical protein
MVESVSSSPFVPNDVKLSNEKDVAMVITGTPRLVYLRHLIKFQGLTW